MRAGGTFVVIADSVRSSPVPGVRGMLMRGMLVTLAHIRKIVAASA